MIKNFIFDFGGVILDIDMPKVFRGFATLGVGAEAMGIGTGTLAANSPVLQLFSQYQCGFISTDEFCSIIASKCKPGTTKEQVAETWLTVCVDLPQHRLDAIQELRKNHKVYLLSNINDLHWDYCCEKWFNRGGHNCEEYFDKLFLSQRMGMEKPNPEIFKKVIADTGIVPEETMFLDDTLENLESAAKLGFLTFHAAPGVDWIKEFVG